MWFKRWFATCNRSLLWPWTSIRAAANCSLVLRPLPRQTCNSQLGFVLAVVLGLTSQTATQISLKTNYAKSWNSRKSFSSSVIGWASIRKSWLVYSTQSVNWTKSRIARILSTRKPKASSQVKRWKNISKGCSSLIRGRLPYLPTQISRATVRKRYNRLTGDVAATITQRTWALIKRCLPTHRRTNH